MKKPARSRGIPALIVCAALAAPGDAPAADAAGQRLWYDEPAAQWVEALPIGNGRLGAMVFGGIGLERLQLNEDTLWAGGPYHPADPRAREALPLIRDLLRDGHYRQAQDLADERFLSVPRREMPYQTIGDLLINMSATEQAVDYRRELDLQTATARTSFRLGGTQHTREYFVSPVDQVIAVRLRAAGRGPGQA